MALDGRPASAPSTEGRQGGARDGEAGAAAALDKLVALPAVALRPAKRAHHLTEFLRRQAQYSEVDTNRLLSRLRS